MVRQVALEIRKRKCERLESKTKEDVCSEMRVLAGSEGYNDDGKGVGRKNLDSNMFSSSHAKIPLRPLLHC